LEGGSRRPQFKAILGYTVRPYCEGVKKKKKFILVQVVHTCNLSYSGGRDQEDLSSKPALGK
jgi:hypothetical protein